MGVQETWAWIVGVVLAIVGIAGFFVLDTGMLFGFGINATHSVVHLITGILFIWAAIASGEKVKMANKWLGVIYILVGIVGFFDVLSFLAVNSADNYLHLGIGIISAAIGWVAK